MKTFGAIIASLFLTLPLLAMPTRDQLKAVQSTVAELMADDMAALKASKIRPEDAAKNAEKLAAMAKEEPARFLLYKGAFGLYVQGGKYAEALASLNKLTAGVKDVSDKVLAEIVREKLKRVSAESGGEILGYYAKLERRVRYAAEKRDAKKLLDERPDDAAARRRLAVALAMLDDWPAALAEFAKLENDERQAADAERGGNAAEAADLWWSCSDPNDEGVQDGFREHAAALYTQALKAGKLEGLKKVLAEKRIAEATGKPFDIGTATAAASPQSHGRAASPLAAGKSDAAPPGAPSAINLFPQPKVKLDTRKLSPIKIPLKGAPAIEFVSIPAGCFHAGGSPGKRGVYQGMDITITRPFLMAKEPLTFAQWRAITGLDHPYEARLRVGSLSAEECQVYQKLGGSSLMANCLSRERDHVLDELNRKFKKKLPAGYIFRLPTWAEAEYVEVGGDPIRRGTPESRQSGWVESENITIPLYAALLKKAGLKLPDVTLPKWVDRRQLLGEYMRSWELNLVPVGTRSPNPFGICDLFQGVVTLDRIGSDILPPGVTSNQDGKSWSIAVIEGFDRSKGGDVDPLFWTLSDDYIYIRRGYLWQSYPMPSKCWVGGVLRLVIGPDLVKEWKAKRR